MKSPDTETKAPEPVVEQPAVVAEPIAVPVPAVEPVVYQVVEISDEEILRLKTKKRTGSRYMISWKTLDGLIARLEAVEAREADE